MPAPSRPFFGGALGVHPTESVVEVLSGSRPCLKPDVRALSIDRQSKASISVGLGEAAEAVEPSSIRVYSTQNYDTD